MVNLSIYMDHEGCGATNSNDSTDGGYDQNHISRYEKIYIMLTLIYHNMVISHRKFNK